MMLNSRQGLVVLLCLIFSGCASAPAVLKYDLEEAAGTVWPATPEVARYQYVGQLTGEENFIHSSDDVSMGRKVFEWIVGVVTGEEAPTVLQRPQSGTVDRDGRIYVTDVSRAAVYVFDGQGGRLDVWEMAGEALRFKTPIGIAVVEKAEGVREILVVDADLKRVVVLDQKGIPQRHFGSDVLTRPTGLARDPESGQLYVADTHGHDIKVFSADGVLLKTLGVSARGEGPGQFNSPTHLTFAAGQLYVTDTLNSRVKIFSADGELVRIFGRRGIFVGDLPRPKGLAVDKDGNIYVVESYYDHLLVFNGEGNLLLPIGGSGSGVGQFYLPAGVWTDHRDRIYVADSFNGRVVILQYLGGA
ncbi:MAG: 6-bladed beta-propeller [Gammaproteobacteria bacterium]|nr:6-bladed beta-propeller [Gammaproteobacteria bacterium]